MPLTHGAQLRPAPPVRLPRVIARLTHAGDDGLRVRRQHGLHVRFGHQGRQVGEHVVPAAEADHLADQVRTVDRHQRPVPDLVEHAHRRAPAVARPQRLQTTTECIGRRLRRDPGAGQPAKTFEITGHVLQLTRLAEKHRQPQAAQLPDQRRWIAAGPGHHQIRTQGEDALHVHGVVRTDTRQLLRRRGVIAVFHHTGDAITGAGAEQQFGNMRSKADNAPRRLVQAYLAAAVVHRRYRGLRQRRGEQHGNHQHPDGFHVTSPHRNRRSITEAPCAN